MFWLWGSWNTKIKRAPCGLFVWLLNTGFIDCMYTPDTDSEVASPPHSKDEQLYNKAVSSGGVSELWETQTRNKNFKLIWHEEEVKKRRKISCCLVSVLKCLWIHFSFLTCSGVFRRESSNQRYSSTSCCCSNKLWWTRAFSDHRLFFKQFL